MPINKTSKALKEKLLANFESNGCVVMKTRRHGEVYSINSKRVNIRCRTKAKVMNNSRYFWYSFDFNLEREIDFVIFIMTNEDYFIIIKPSVLADIKDKLDFGSRNNTRTFYIDWDNLSLPHKKGYLDLAKYHGSFSDEDVNLPDEIIVKVNK